MSFAPVLKLVAAAGVTLSPANGQGIVTIGVTPGTFAPDGAFYLVNQATNAPPHAIDMSTFGGGVLQQTVTGGVSTPTALNVATGRIPFGASGVLATDATLRTAIDNLWTPGMRSLRLGNSPSPYGSGVGLINIESSTVTPFMRIGSFGSTALVPQIWLTNDSGTSVPSGMIFQSSTTGTGALGFTGLAPSALYLTTALIGGGATRSDVRFASMINGGTLIETFIIKADGAAFWPNSSATISAVGQAGLRSNGGHLQYSENGSAWTNISSAAGITQLTGDVAAGPGSGSQAATIQPAAVTYAKIQNVTNNRVLGNVSGGAHVPMELTASDLSTLLGLAPIALSGSAADLTTGTIPAARLGAFTGDATSAGGTYALTISALPLTKLQTISDQRILGNVSGGSAVPAQLTPAQVATMVYGAFTNKDVLYATGANSVGQTANFQFDAAATTLSVPTVSAVGAGSLTLKTGAAVLTLNNGPTTASLTGGLVPSADLTYALGANGAAWSALWVDTIAKTGVPGTIAMVTSQGPQIDSNTTGNFLITHQSSNGRFISDATGIGFFPVVGGAPTGVAQQTILGSRGGNAALADLLTKLANYGLIIDSTSP